MEYIIEIDYNNTQLNDQFIGLSGGVLRYCTATQLPLSEAMAVEISPNTSQTFSQSVSTGQLYQSSSAYKTANTLFAVYEKFGLTSTNDYLNNPLADAKGSTLAIGDIFSYRNDNEDGTILYKGNKFIVKNTLITDSIKTLSRSIDMKRGAGYNYTGSAEISFFVGETAENVPPLNGAELRVYENNYCVFTGAISQNKLSLNGVMTVTAEDSLRASGADAEILTNEIVPNDNYTGSPFFLPLVVGDVEVAKLIPITSSGIKKTGVVMPFFDELGWGYTGLGIGAINTAKTTIGQKSNVVVHDGFVGDAEYTKWQQVVVGDIIKVEENSRSFMVSKIEVNPVGYVENSLVIYGSWASLTMSTDTTKYVSRWLLKYLSSESYALFTPVAESITYYAVGGILTLQPSFESVIVSNIVNQDNATSGIVKMGDVSNGVKVLSGDDIATSNIPVKLSPTILSSFRLLSETKNYSPDPPNPSPYQDAVPYADNLYYLKLYEVTAPGDTIYTRGYETKVKLSLEIDVESLVTDDDLCIILDAECYAEPLNFIINNVRENKNNVELYYRMASKTEGNGLSVLEEVVAKAPYFEASESLGVRREAKWTWAGYNNSDIGILDYDRFTFDNINDTTKYFSPLDNTRQNGMIIVKGSFIKRARYLGQNNLQIALIYNFCTDEIPESSPPKPMLMSVIVDVKYIHFYRITGQSKWSDLYCTAKNANNTPYLAVNNLLNKIKPYINKTNTLNITHGDWHTGRQITDQSSVVDIVSGLALQCCAKMMQERKGAINVSYMQDISINEWIFNEFNIVRNSVKPIQYSSVDGLYNKFNCKYHFDHRLNQYKYAVSVDKIDQTDFPLSTDPTWKTFVSGIDTYAVAKGIWETCHQSYLDTGVIRQAPAELQELKWINKDSVFGYSTNTIEKYLKYTVDWYAPRKAVISFRIPLLATYGKMELGDRCTVTDYVATANQPRSGYITGIKRNPKNGVIDIDAIVFTQSSGTGNIIEQGDTVNQIIEQGNTVDQIIEQGE